MALGRSDGAELPDLVLITRPICPNKDFPKHDYRPKWSGRLFRHSHKDRTDSFFNEFVKGSEHRENIFGEFKFIYSCSNICYSYVC